LSFLKKLLKYNKICIQCHDNPDSDTIASAFGVYCYLIANGIEAQIIYSGSQVIKKSCTKMLIKECKIEINYVKEIDIESDFDLLLLVDCQYGQGNVEKFPAKKIAIIDHHIQVVEDKEYYLIKSNYQSCSTVVWEMLCEENYPIKENQNLAIALLYGLYTDTSCFADLYNKIDCDMRADLFSGQPLFERLSKTSMSIAELLVASDAMLNHYLDVERKFVIVEALKCDQTVLGIIGDFVIQVDVVFMSFSYSEIDNDYQISLRSCHENIKVNDVAKFICTGIGSGGGHCTKAGGRILKEKLIEKYGDMKIFDVINMLICQYIDENMIFKSI